MTILVMEMLFFDTLEDVLALVWIVATFGLILVLADIRRRPQNSKLAPLFEYLGLYPLVDEPKKIRHRY